MEVTQRMARKNATAGKKPKTPRSPKPVECLKKVMFLVRDVVGKNFETDNMDYINPRCINVMDDGDVVAVYEFVGIQKVSRATSFADATYLEALKASRD